MYKYTDLPDNRWGITYSYQSPIVLLGCESGKACLSGRSSSSFTYVPQGVRSSLESCLRSASLKWSLSSSVPHSSGIICMLMTTTPDVSSWDPSRVESLSWGATLEACYSTLTASLRPTTSRCIHWGAGTELERRGGKVKDQLRECRSRNDEREDVPS